MPLVPGRAARQTSVQVSRPSRTELPPTSQRLYKVPPKSIQIFRVSVLASLLTYVAARSILECRMKYSGVCNLPRSHILNVLCTKHLQQFCIVQAGGPGLCQYDPNEVKSLQVPCDSTFPVSTVLSQQQSVISEFLNTGSVSMRTPSVHIMTRILVERDL